MDESVDVGGGTTESSPVESSPPTIDSVFAEVEHSLGSAPETPAPAPAPVAAPVPPSGAVTPPAAPPALDREALTQEVRSAYEQELGPDALELVRGLRADPLGTALEIANFLQNHPVHGQAYRSQAGRILSSFRQSAKANDPGPEPGPDIDGGNGIHLYSAPQMAKWKEWNNRNLLSQIDQKYAPLVQDHTARQQQQRELAEYAERVEGTKAFVGEFGKMPHFAEHREAIKQRQAQIYKAMPVGQRDPRMALTQAYAEVLAAQIPKAQATTQASLVSQAAQKLQAATHDPATRAPAQPRAIKTAGRSQDAILNDVFEQAVAEASA